MQAKKRLSWVVDKGDCAKSGNLPVTTRAQYSRRLGRPPAKEHLQLLFPCNLWDVEVLLGIFLKTREVPARVDLPSIFLDPGSTDSKLMLESLTSALLGWFHTPQVLQTLFLHTLHENSESYMSIR